MSGRRTSGSITRYPTADQIRKQARTNLQNSKEKKKKEARTSCCFYPSAAFIQSGWSRLGSLFHAGPPSLRLLPTPASALPSLPARAARTVVAPRQAPDQKAAAVQRVAAPAPRCCTTAKERKSGISASVCPRRCFTCSAASFYMLVERRLSLDCHGGQRLSV